jgi:hypothetical protein
VAVEASYKQVLRSYGLPESFYDSQDDFHSMLGNDVSPQELQDRAQLAQQVWLSKDEETKKVWRESFGSSGGAAIAAILDPEKAMPVLQRMATAAQMGGAALRNGLDVNTDRFQRYADLGVSAADAAKGFSEIGQTQSTDSAIAQRFGQTFTQQDAEEATLLGTASQRRRQDQLRQAEKNLFSDAASASESSLSRRSAGTY